MDRDRAKNRIIELIYEGNRACSRYDLMMGYDAKFNLGLAFNHLKAAAADIRYFRKHRIHDRQLSLF